MGEVVSLLERKAEKLGLDNVDRHIDVCPLCEAFVHPCNVDEQKTVSFICVAASHAPFSWKQERLADRILSTRPKTTRR
jgi:hypothetical protein